MSGDDVVCEVCGVCLVPGEMRQRLRWADGRLVKEAIDLQLEALVGPRGQDSPHNNTEEVTYHVPMYDPHTHVPMYPHTRCAV